MGQNSLALNSADHLHRIKVNEVTRVGVGSLVFSRCSEQVCQIYVQLLEVLLLVSGEMH